MGKVSVIIPSRELHRKKNPRYFYKPVSSLLDLLEDLRSDDSVDKEVIVVCNGRGDSALVEAVQSHAGIDKFCINSANAGVSRAWNMGRMLAEGDSLLIVNDDVRIAPGSLRQLHEALWSERDIGQVGPKGALWENGQHVRFVGETSPEDASAIAGFCFMTRADAFDRAGGIDIRFTPAGFEEIDYSFTLRKLGFRCRVLPDLEIRTEPMHGISARKENIEFLSSRISTGDLHERNRRLFFEKWGIPL